MSRRICPIGPPGLPRRNRVEFRATVPVPGLPTRKTAEIGRRTSIAWCSLLAGKTCSGWRIETFRYGPRPGKLDALKPLAGAFVNSFRVEQSWYARFSKAQQQWIAAKQQGIANAGALSRAISRSNDQFTQNLMQSWNARQQAEDRASREFSEYIRDSENYYDPVNEMQVELPGGYQKAWTNNQGEYLLSDVPGYNPNLNSNLNWEEIRPIR